MKNDSMFARYTFYWLNAILKTAKAKGRLEENDIPVLFRSHRSEHLLKEFNSISKSPKLYRHMIRIHWPMFLKVYIGSIVTTTATFMPPFILNQILKCLERRDAGEDMVSEVWLWVLGLALVKVFESFAIAYVFWLCFVDLMIPIRTQLAATLFSKTMRKKDVKGIQKENEDAATNLKDTNANKDDEEEEELGNTNQATTNLISVDTERIGLFAALSGIFVESAFGMIYGFGFIVYVLGLVPRSSISQYRCLYIFADTWIFKMAEFTRRVFRNPYNHPVQHLLFEKIRESSG